MSAETAAVPSAAATSSAAAAEVAATSAAFPAATSAAGATNKRVITYSLYGTIPKYVEGAVKNARLIGAIFPGWTARFYADESTVPPRILAELRELGAEIVPIDMAKHGHQSMVSAVEGELQWRWHVW